MSDINNSQTSKRYRSEVKSPIGEWFDDQVDVKTRADFDEWLTNPNFNSNDTDSKRSSISPAKRSVVNQFPKLSLDVMRNLQDYLNKEELSLLAALNQSIGQAAQSQLDDYLRCHSLSEYGGLCRDEKFTYKQKCRRYCQNFTDFYLDNVDYINTFLYTKLGDRVDFVDYIDEKSGQPTFCASRPAPFLGTLSSKVISFYYKLGEDEDIAIKLYNIADQVGMSINYVKAGKNSLIEADITSEDLIALINRYFRLEPNDVTIRLVFNFSNKKVCEQGNNVIIKPINVQVNKTIWNFLYDGENDNLKNVIEVELTNTKLTTKPFIDDIYTSYAKLMLPIVNYDFLDDIRWNELSFDDEGLQKKHQIVSSLGVPEEFVELVVRNLDTLSINDTSVGISYEQINQELQQWKELTKLLPPDLSLRMDRAIDKENDEFYGNRRNDDI